MPEAPKPGATPYGATAPGAPNDLLGVLHPAARALLSPLGLRATLPLGIPQQSAQARECTRKATIGQITDRDGRPLLLPSLGRHFSGLDPRQAFLYAPQHGLPELRRAWGERIAEQGVPMSVPLVTSGMSHGISLCADLFTSPDTPVLLPGPFWDNYDNIFTMRTGAPIRTFDFYRDGRFDVESLSERLSELQGPATLLLNFPGNPTGYSLTEAEAPTVLETIFRHPHPLTVICDDAYGGLVFEEGVYRRSLFQALAKRGDPSKLLACKVDGATKELVFFGGRVGFLTFSAEGEAGEILAEKAAAVLRGTISSVAAPSQAAVLSALRSPTLAAEQKVVIDILAGRFQALKRELTRVGLPFFPFNSGCFAMMPVPEGEDCEAIRHRLIREQSLGVIAVPQSNALRVAFCSVEEADIPDVVERLRRVLQPSSPSPDAASPPNAPRARG